ARRPAAGHPGTGTPGHAPPASAAQPGLRPTRRGRHRRSGRRLVAVLLAMVAIAGAVTAALVLRDRDGSGTGTDGSGTETTTEAGDAATGNEVDLDQDDDGRIDRPGPPPGHVEPAAALAPLQVSALVNGNHEGFERVSISFTGDLPPAVELRPDHVSGLVRVWFPETSPSGATDPDAAS